MISFTPLFHWPCKNYTRTLKYKFQTANHVNIFSFYICIQSFQPYKTNYCDTIFSVQYILYVYSGSEYFFIHNTRSHDRFSEKNSSTVLAPCASLETYIVTKVAATLENSRLSYEFIYMQWCRPT